MIGMNAMMKNSTGTKFLMAVALGFGAPAISVAQPAPHQAGATKPTPPGWNYQIVNGQRVPKGNRVTNADGSWREEIRQGKCTTIKEKSAAGEYKESRSCS
jgi:hypothetical protein